MDIGFKRMNWVQERSAYEEMTAWREKQRAAIERFEETTAAAASTFASAQTGLFAGLAELTAQRVIENAQTQLQARANSLTASLDETLGHTGTVLDKLA